jgi:hypothetical protein
MHMQKQPMFCQAKFRIERERRISCSTKAAAMRRFLGHGSRDWWRGHGWRRARLALLERLKMILGLKIASYVSFSGITASALK